MAPRFLPSVQQDAQDTTLSDIFVDTMLGTPLPVYIEKDVQDRDNLVALVTKHGGSISPGYSGVPCILVDPLKPSGQNLFRQYSGKRGKIVLDVRWISECIRAGQLQTFHTNWAGCKVTGNETDQSTEILSAPPAPDVPTTSRPIDLDQSVRIISPPAPTLHPQVLDSATVEQMVHAAQTQSHFPYPMYTHPPPTAPNWPGGTIPPQHDHLPTAQPTMIQRPPYREDTWEAYDSSNGHAGDPLVASAHYDYRYRDDQAGWVTSEAYYDYDQTYDQAAAASNYLDDPDPPASTAGQPSSQSQPSPPPPASSSPTPAPVPIVGPSSEPVRPSEVQVPERGRGRKRNRTVLNLPAAPPSSLVVNRNPPARSPTPPTRVVKSTYGGNLFTADDIVYLKKYIDYCQEQGLVLSLREICERIAIKAPHHTFYSWRRYCNKHQIRLGGYAMNPDRTESPHPDGGENDLEDEVGMQAGPEPGPGTTEAAQGRIQSDARTRNRSPTPPRALYRSTTGKGVAFTDEDVAFLVRFMEYRKAQGRLDMVAFWKDVAAKAPHHSRASWMKYWRRHKHELERADGDDQSVPSRPDKKMRYSREDDVLLANYFCNQPEGTSDKVFQTFGRQHPHHPWKGWQEHHRIHKAKIDHYIKRLKNGENIDVDDGETAS
ncbi:hypothetical protein E1B28_010124 [Marasmius oreades]|uniref:BRCT domain-containing protein n=1 Tax=Marasmius oreades TaxID=181124 RepID=A0A9P7UQT9_9AGAR|nr:uncharacterized protein E1B28_010124 [Marasmius oreades]KAG7091067.1 hypothetical protein E1B28_010124 [Marasmius oreades]